MCPPTSLKQKRKTEQEVECQFTKRVCPFAKYQELGLVHGIGNEEKRFL